MNIRSLKTLVAGVLTLASVAAIAAPGAMEGVEKQPVNVSAIAMFLAFVLLLIRP